MDVAHYKIKQEGRYIGKTIYTLLGLTLNGEKESLSITWSEKERATNLDNGIDR